MNKNNQRLYLDDYSMEDIIDLSLSLLSNNNHYNNNDHINDIDDNIIEVKTKENKPSFALKSNYNSKGEKIVVFSINIPLKKNGLKIDILINDEMYKNIGKHFK
jgi:hypothetical protein